MPVSFILAVGTFIMNFIILTKKNLNKKITNEEYIIGTIMIIFDLVQDTVAILTG
jgi:hypothetical protein